MALQISERGRKMPASPIRKLMPLADEAKRRGVKVYHLNIGQPDLETPPAMRAKLAQAPERATPTRPRPAPPECLATLREYYRRLGVALAARRRSSPPPAAARRSSSPSWPARARATRSWWSSPSTRTTRPSRPWRGCASSRSARGARTASTCPRSRSGEAHSPPRTRLVLLCNPGNPTGTVYRPRRARGGGGLLPRARALPGVRRGLPRVRLRRPRVGQRADACPGYDDLAIVVDSLSKRYSACGIRLGCLATRNADVYGAALRMAQGRLSPPGLAQLVALGATELGARLREGHRARVPGAPRRALRGALADPGRLPAEAGGRFLLRGPAADRRRRGLRLVAAHRLRPRRRDGHGGARRRASTRRPGSAATRCASPTSSRRRTSRPRCASSATRSRRTRRSGWPASPARGRRPETPGPLRAARAILRPLAWGLVALAASSAVLAWLGLTAAADLARGRERLLAGDTVAAAAAFARARRWPGASAARPRGRGGGDGRRRPAGRRGRRRSTRSSPWRPRPSSSPPSRRAGSTRRPRSPTSRDGPASRSRPSTRRRPRSSAATSPGRARSPRRARSRSTRAASACGCAGRARRERRARRRSCSIAAASWRRTVARDGAPAAEAETAPLLAGVLERAAGPPRRPRRAALDRPRPEPGRPGGARRARGARSSSSSHAPGPCSRR